MPDYVPGVAPPSLSPADMAQWAQEEFVQIARTLLEFRMMKLEVLNAAPAKPRAGMIVAADGTNWNPGSGVGFYGYIGGAWVKF